MATLAALIATNIDILTCVMHRFADSSSYFRRLPLRADLIPEAVESVEEEVVVYGHTK
jgi:hypothetical protein